jgi:hypothetical protein
MPKGTHISIVVRIPIPEVNWHVFQGMYRIIWLGILEPLVRLALYSILGFLFIVYLFIFSLPIIMPII